MNNDELRAELATLIMRRASGDMTDEEFLRMESLLLSEPGARRLYVQYINDTLSLQELLAGVDASSGRAAFVSPPFLGADQQGAHAPRSPRMRSPKTRSPGKRRRWLVAAALAASLLIAGVFAGRWLLSESEPVAQLTRTANAQWADSAPGRGEAILSGRTLQLTAGFAEIKFHSGARVVLEGPASLTLESANAGRLATGKLVARVPKQAHGFTIYTAAETIVDRGTEFGVWVREEGVRGQGSGVRVKEEKTSPPASFSTEVHVFTGRVDVTPAPQSEIRNLKSEILTRGQALRTDAGQAPVSIAAQPEQFVRTMPPLLSDDFESYAKDSDMHERGPWRLFYGFGAYQRARAVEPAASPQQIFGQRVVELRDSYGSPKFADPLLQARIAPGNVPEDLRIQFDFRRLDAETAPRVTLHNASWQLVLGPELRLKESNAPPLAPIEPNQWYRLTLNVPSGAEGGKLRVRLEKLAGDQFVDPVSAEYQVGPSIANDTIDFTYLSQPQQPKAGAWQIDNLRVELAE